MTTDEMAALPIKGMAEENAHLYLWTINRYVEDAYRLARMWGFWPSTLLTWCKPRKGKGLGGAFSLTTEFCLFARRGSLPHAERWPESAFHWPRGRHSEKPEAFFDVVEQISPPPYLELFARRARLGWDYWGDESLQTVELAI